jgi:hypothetical protein
MNECHSCASTGLCPCCNGDGLVLVVVAVDTCSRCANLNPIENGGMRAWCPECGGVVRYIEQPVECEECSGNGACSACSGEGQVLE